MEKCEPTKLDENEYYAFKNYIMSLGLSVRATNVLLRNCFSLEDVFGLNAKIMRTFQSCGKKTIREVLDLLDILNLNDFTETSLDVPEQLALPPEDFSLDLLPLFSSKKLKDISVGNLHKGFNATTKLSDLVLSTRTANVLNDLEMTTVGEAILFPGNALLRTKNFGRKSLKELREIVRSLCFPDSQVEEQDAVDYSSYDVMVECFINQCVKSKRDQQLFKQRFCFTDGKVPTLEELGQQFGITRERARQILKKGLDKLRIKANLDRLRSFWQKLDDLVLQGGGLVKLETLSTVLQAHYEWPTPPFPLALGQFLLLKEADAVFKQADDLLEIPCPCQSCNVPQEQLQRFDFEATESFHIQVVAARLSEHCQKQCPEGKPVATFYPAFIELLVENSDGLLMCHDDLVLPYERWREKYCDNLEDVACQVLASHGEPMHFREIANGIRQANENFKDHSDHSIHNALLRYSDSIELTNRGTYGLIKWGLGGYRSISIAIEEVIDNHGLPIRAKDITAKLDGEFPGQHIYTALSSWKTRFQGIGDGFYDRPQNWQERTCQGLIKLLPEPVVDLANYLVSRNNTSYKLAMAFIFIRSMDEDGSIYIYKLKDMFYNFYRSRYKKGLVVELDSSVMSLIAELSPADIKNKASKEPLKSFLHTDFFQVYSQNGAKIKLSDFLVSALQESTARDTLIITILKAIDDYYLRISPAIAMPVASPPPHVAEPRRELERDQPEVEPEQYSPSITIKKKRRGKIKL